MFIPFKYDVDGVMFSFSLIYWAVGVKQIINSIYNGVARVITTKPFAPETYFNLVEKYKVTILTNTPFHMMCCLKNPKINKSDLSSVKLIMFYGGKLAENTVPDIRYHFPNAELMVNCLNKKKLLACSQTKLFFFLECLRNDRDRCDQYK